MHYRRGPIHFNKLDIEKRAIAQFKTSRACNV